MLKSRNNQISLHALHFSHLKIHFLWSSAPSEAAVSLPLLLFILHQMLCGYPASPAKQTDAPQLLREKKKKFYTEEFAPCHTCHNVLQQWAILAGRAVEVKKTNLSWCFTPSLQGTTKLPGECDHYLIKALRVGQSWRWVTLLRTKLSKLSLQSNWFGPDCQWH